MYKHFQDNNSIKTYFYLICIHNIHIFIKIQLQKNTYKKGGGGGTDVFSFFQIFR